jgi:multiple sugar transport system substrate-binding protein
MKVQTLGAWGLLTALTFGVPGQVHAQSAAEIAVEAAKAYAGTEITILWEAGLPALDPLNFSGPKWKELTSIDVEVIELPTAEIRTAILQEHRTGSGAYDALNVVPSWMTDLVQVGALENLDPYVDKYGYRQELQEIAPAYRDNQMTVDGKIYGFPDDGDILLLFYRKDIFDANSLQPPKTWLEFSLINRELTDLYGPSPKSLTNPIAAGGTRILFGSSLNLDPSFAQFMFQNRFRIAGGRFFDAETMKATVNSAIGAEVFTQMREDNLFMPPGVESWGFEKNLKTFLKGRTAMTISWPAYGRWAAGYGVDEEALSWLPESRIAGKVGYALPPGGQPQLAGGSSLAVSSSSRNKEPAYLFIQWLNSKDISLERVQLPYAVRDPFRKSHFESEAYRSRWPAAPEYLATLKAGAVTGLIDLSLIETHKYEQALREGISRLWVSGRPQAILDDVAEQWDAITEEIGIERQREAYQAWASKPNAYPN